MNLFSASNPAVAAAFTVVFLIAGLFSIEVSAQTRAWGENGYGQLGIGNTINQPLPQTVTAMPDATGISSGLYHTLFLKSDGTVAAAGYNGHGQLGTGVGGANQSTPVPVPNLTTVVQVTAGIFHSAALLSDGTVRSWGSNLEGQIGNGKISQPTGCHCIPTPT
ncbi:MAG TPA: hypothetical protein VK400_04125, partial [Pyrinomonadaceae bacterium]|nr:hypothetical protein [Pyrinomonadaceae bacterium]